MSRFPRLTRYVAAAALAASTLTVLSTSPASAATGSLAAASNGFTVTWTGTGPNDMTQLMMWSTPHTCSTNDSPLQANYVLYGDPTAPANMQLSASPASYTFGSAVFDLSSFGATTIAAGSYVVCLLSVVSGVGGATTLLGNLAVTIVDPNASPTTTAAPTTTTTAAPSTTTTAAVEEPVVPVHTG